MTQYKKDLKLLKSKKARGAGKRKSITAPAARIKDGSKRTNPGAGKNARAIKEAGEEKDEGDIVKKADGDVAAQKISITNKKKRISH